jgi:hypothetical protein
MVSWLAPSPEMRVFIGESQENQILSLGIMSLTNPTVSLEKAVFIG